MMPERILPRLVGRVILSFEIVGVGARVADRGGPVAVPLMVEKDDRAGDRDGFPFDWGARVARIANDAHVHWRIVHVVLNAFAVDELQPQCARVAELQVRAEIDSPCLLY